MSSFPDYVKGLLRKAMKNFPEAPFPDAASPETKQTLLVVSLSESVLALKDAILLVTYEVEQLRGRVDELERNRGS